MFKKRHLNFNRLHCAISIRIEFFGSRNLKTWDNSGRIPDFLGDFCTLPEGDVKARAGQ